MKSKERLTWIISTLVLALLFAGIGAAPRLTAQTKDAETETYLSMISFLFKYVQENFVDEVSSETLYEGAVQGLFDSLGDPYSVYLTASDMEDFTDTTEGNFGGVGLFISKQTGVEEDRKENGTFRQQHAQFVEVVAPIEATPAYRAGIHAGDFIIAIEDESTADLTMDEVIDRLRGEPGTKVEVTIRRKPSITFDVTITRAIIEVPTSKDALIAGHIGYIRIIRWTPYTMESIETAVKNLNSQGADSYIFDVRGNPGGLLSSVVDTSDLFLSEGIIVGTESRIAAENEKFMADRKTVIPENVPMIVLIDKGSASASEIFAGAMKDTGRAHLIGETTFGKGSVQQIRSFGSGGFKLTTSRYYTPSGTVIDKVGIEPHEEIIEADFTDEELESLQELLDSNAVPLFIDENHDPGETEIQQFITDMRKDGIILEERYLRRMIRTEINRTKDNPPVYDMEYDTVLQAAVEQLEAGGR